MIVWTIGLGLSSTCWNLAKSEAATQTLACRGNDEGSVLELLRESHQTWLAEESFGRSSTKEERPTLLLDGRKGTNWPDGALELDLIASCARKQGYLADELAHGSRCSEPVKNRADLMLK